MAGGRRLRRERLVSAKEARDAAPPESQRAIRYRIIVPFVLAGLVLAYELLWKRSLLQPGSLADHLVNLLLFFLVGPVMAWWGQSMAHGLVRRLARSEAASEEKSRFLEQRNRQLQMVLQASRAMAAVLDLRQVSSLVVEQVVTYTRFARACLVLGQGEGDPLTVAASRGLPEPFLAEFVQAVQGPGRAASPVEWCRVTRQPVVVENLGRDFRTAGLRSVFAAGGVEGMIAVPLLYNEQFRGALTVYLEKGGPISTAEISLVSALAAQAALALENARLYTLTARQHARLDSAMEFFQHLASALARTRAGVSPLVHLVAQVSAKLFAPARVHLNITTAVRQSPMTVSEIAGLEPGTAEELALSLPVALDGEQFGQIDVYLEQGRCPEPGDQQILQAYINLAASALGNATVIAEMRQAVEEVERAYMGTLEALTKALEMRDHETQGHSRRVVQYTLSLAQKLGIPEQELVPIIRGALLHDIGKIGIPDAILKKQGPLSPEEWQTMRKHPLIGYDMLRGIEFLHEATTIILHHHEWYNGKGYPQGLAGEAIPVGARIFAVADAYDAITSDRPYRRGRGHEAAMAEIAAGADTQFDPQVVAAMKALPGEELARIRGRDLEVARSATGMQ
jgi:putative nucleotidyltransferase with HDIG domain